MDITYGFKVSILSKIVNQKLVLLTIELGQKFPLDSVKIRASKFSEVSG